MPIENQKENRKNFDLEERTGKFGEDVIQFVQKLTKNTVTIPLMSQLIRSATSIGANYCEADGAESKRDFRHKIGICKKESKETKHWLRMIMVANPGAKEDAQRLWNEAQELTLIFSAIIKKC